MKDKTENANSKTKKDNDNVLFYVLKALKKKRYRRTLYVFIFMMLLGGLFEATSSARVSNFLSDSFGVIGFGGLVLSLGIQLRSELPSPPFENPDHITYHMISIIWIVGGSAFLFAYIKYSLLPFLK
ncbi:MAG: hypothetical protein GY755_18975 [Chloroflexi bacterium]|nr:hypothetical protein [Chloroflexota bacterium]